MHINIGVLPPNVTTRALQVFWLFSLKFPFVSQLLFRNASFCWLCRVSRTWRSSVAGRIFLPGHLASHSCSKAVTCQTGDHCEHPIKTARNKWLLFTWHIKLQVVMVFIQGNKRKHPHSIAGSGLCCEGRKPGWYAVGSTHRQTVSILLTKVTNVGTSQLGNYYLICVVSREETQHIFFEMELHYALISSWH